jgi:hypothetical protein
VAIFVVVSLEATEIHEQQPDMLGLAPLFERRAAPLGCSQPKIRVASCRS